MPKYSSNPRVVGPAIADAVTGFYAAYGVLGALHERAKTGKGTSVLEIIKAFSAACGKELPYVIEPRRAGDVTANYADCTKAKEQMGWEARYGIDEMCRDSWNWQSRNPNGYEG